MSRFSKVMNNKVSELNFENVSNRSGPIAQGLGPESLYLGFHKSVFATRHNNTGLAKPGQLSQVKRIQH